jgi:hypothetical protein
MQRYATQKSSPVKRALDLRLDAQRLRALASPDPIHQAIDLAVASASEAESERLLRPPKPLQMGLGGEIIPTVADNLPGLELTLREPDLLNLEASKQRSELIERAGVLALGVETANDSVATGSLQKMLCHQLAAAHRRALILLTESEKTQDTQTSCLKAKTAARLINAFGAAALTLQRLQAGVGHNFHQVQINGHVIGHIGK